MLKDKKRICVFCGSSLGNDKLIQKEVIKLAKIISENNLEYKFFYTSSIEYDLSQKYTLDNFLHLYTSKSLHPTDLDAGYQNITPFRRSFYEGVKNTKNTTIDGDYPVIIRTTSPTIAVPTDGADSNLRVVDDKLK